MQRQMPQPMEEPPWVKLLRNLDQAVVGKVLTPPLQVRGHSSLLHGSGLEIMYWESVSI